MMNSVESDEPYQIKIVQMPECPDCLLPALPQFQTTPVQKEKQDNRLT
ncbi:hypothetical protein ACLEUY_17930 [Enterobacter ludwigii]